MACRTRWWTRSRLVRARPLLPQPAAHVWCVPVCAYMHVCVQPRLGPCIIISSSCSSVRLAAVACRPHEGAKRRTHSPHLAGCGHIGI